MGLYGNKSQCRGQTVWNQSSTFNTEINFQLNGEPRKIREDNSHCWCVFRSAGFVCYHTDNLLPLLAATTWERKSERKPQVWVQQRLGQKYVNRSNFSNWNVKIFSVLKTEFIRRRQYLPTIVAFGEMPYQFMLRNNRVILTNKTAA